MGNGFFKVYAKDENDYLTFTYNGDFVAILDETDIFEGLDIETSTFLFENLTFSKSFTFPKGFLDEKTLTFENCAFQFAKFTGLYKAAILFSECRFLDDCASFIDVTDSTISFYSNIYLFELASFNNSECHLYLHTNSRVVIRDAVKSKFYTDKEDLQQDVYSAKINIYNSKQIRLDLSNIELDSFFYENVEIDYLRLIDCFGQNVILFNEDVFGNLRIKKIHIIDCKFDSLFLGTKIETIGSLEFPIDKLHIDSQSNISIVNIWIKQLTLEGSTTERLKIFNCVLSDLKFKSFSNNSSVDFDLVNFNGDAVLEIKRSSLDNVNFSPSFLNQIKIINFTKSTLKGLKLSNFRYFDPSSIMIEKESTIYDKMDFTRELTALMIQLNDNYHATLYKSLEQEFRLESKDYRVKSDRIILTLNSLSNSHGTKPEKAFALMVLIILIHFLVMRVEFALNATWLSASDFFWGNISYYFKPITFISDINFQYYKFSKWFVLFDFVYKISFGYLLYQFIAAFRKFNKQ